MNILITGGTGFIGKHFVPELLKGKHSVRLLVRDLDKAKKLFGDTCEYFVADVTDKRAIEGCCKDIDIVYHMVAKVGNELPNEEILKQFRKVNVYGTQNIMEDAKVNNVKKFIFVSSIAAMGIVHEEVITEESSCNPYLPYQVSKYEAEQILLEEYKKTNFPVIIIRPTKVYGVGESEYSYLILAKLCKKHVFPKVGFDQNYTSNVYITDLVQSLVKLVDKGRMGEVYIITSKDSIAFEDSAKVIARELKVKVFFIFIPESLMILTANIIEKIFNKLGKKPPVTKKNVEATVTNRVYDISKANKDLCYYPQISMKNGIKAVVKWYRDIGLV